jgi:hypothetical protein
MFEKDYAWLSSAQRQQNSQQAALVKSTPHRLIDSKQFVRNYARSKCGSRDHVTRGRLRNRCNQADRWKMIYYPTQSSPAPHNKTGKYLQPITASRHDC